MASPNAARGSSKQSDDAAEAEIVDAFCIFLAKHYGSVLRAWRSVLDPNGDGEVLYSEFIEVVASMPKWHEDVTALWTALMRRARAHIDDAVLRLRELSVVDYQCLEDFRQWATAAFGGVLDVFEAATHFRANAVMSFFEFTEVCRSNGFSGDCHKIFHHCLCPDSYIMPEGSERGASMRDIAYLETRAIRRKEAMDPGFLVQQQHAKATAEKMRQRRQRLKRGQADALEEFLRKVRKVSSGSLIRGWRRILDTNGNLAIGKTELLKGCRKIAYSGDVVALWKSLDIDDDGIVYLEEVDAPMALVLASFKKWSSESNGSCVATLVQLGNLIRRQSGKWDQESFCTALKQAKFPGCPSLELSDKHAASMLYETFDVDHLGFFTVQDVAFLDKWSPTPWLMADPSEEDRERFIKALTHRFPNLIVAWRKLLDRDNKNKVSYKEFLNACVALKMANPAGIWRSLDDDSSGFISLEEIDKEAAATLFTFKRWAEDQFGTITHMFHVFDKAKLGKVSFPVFRRGLRNFDFEGDALNLFVSLKPNTSTGKSSKKKNSSRHELTLPDLLYLSTWEENEGDAEDAEIEDLSREASKRRASKAQGALKPPSSPSRTESGASRRGAPAPPPAYQPSPPERSLAPIKETSESMAHCRSIDEYKAFISAGHKQRLADVYGRNHNEQLLYAIDQGHNRQGHKLPQLSPSSRGLNPGPFLAPAVADIGLGRKLSRGYAGSRSEQHLPRVSPNGARRDVAAMAQMPTSEGGLADRVMAKRARLHQAFSLPSL